ncbi:hypothetical protein [Nannocystis pusilla]|uniref:Uncharacterized protein n=1 Tax=Nannocystis pusilla TaxID=889268 RepID=A0ABS7TJB7_9BACT|nr:hypothetical protein [Nannocystis pusilla]MBZ5708212.1 hypothetical protein [Nannocystis pusilla]
MGKTTEEAMAERAQMLRALLPNGISDSLTQRELDATMLEIMHDAKVPLEYAYAYMKTKRLVTEENMQHLSDEELEEWNLAVEDYLANPDPSRIPKPGDPSPYDMPDPPPRTRHGRSRWKRRR